MDNVRYLELTHGRLRSFVGSFVSSLVHWFVDSLVRWFVRPFVRSFVRSFNFLRVPSISFRSITIVTITAVVDCRLPCISCTGVNVLLPYFSRRVLYRWLCSLWKSAMYVLLQHFSRRVLDVCIVCGNPQCTLMSDITFI